MFKKILVANRGAIAVRIIRTLKALGIQSIAVYTRVDRDSLHVKLADHSVCLGDGVAVAETYLNQNRILEIAEQNRAEAIHPGYGFLSENPAFARACQAKNIVFIGPTAAQIEAFGLKHTAREIASEAGVPMLPGSELLRDINAAVIAAEEIGYPVMLKSTAGGGGIGMQLCHDEDELRDAFDSVKRLSANNFSNDGVFLEKYIVRARHIEVQIVGNGRGDVLAIGERDCSSQRRNQKVVEECPAPNLQETTRKSLHKMAESLCSSVDYLNAGTVEFIFDVDFSKFYFLEVNTRLQVEHGVTEQVYDIDLVEWMVQIAAGDSRFNDSSFIKQLRDELQPFGHAIQVRLYAEDPNKGFQPSADLLTEVVFPSGTGLRIDSWIETGTTVSPYFDPMLAKVIAHDNSRSNALDKLRFALDDIRLYGTETNLDYLRQLCADQQLIAGTVTTRYLDDFEYLPRCVDVLSGGTQTTIQDVPGRKGYWHVGIPPSGPFDSYSFRVANKMLGNEEMDAGLEITLQGPTLKFTCETQMVLAGAAIDAKIDDKPIAMWQVHNIEAGQTLNLGKIIEHGARSYLCIGGGIQCPRYLESRSTFTLGKIGGHNGRALHAGDVLKLAATTKDSQAGLSLDTDVIPSFSASQEIRVIYGPHGAPDFFTEEDIDRFFGASWEVHYNSSRTGIRLIGPKPQWARQDGGEAGLHPSNIHDNAYAFGSIDFTGDMPVILGPDGPSLGGFVCPATVITADLWKLGQLSAGDKIKFIPVSLEDAILIENRQRTQLKTLRKQSDNGAGITRKSPVLERLSIEQYSEQVVYRSAGDRFVLVEYGEQKLDLKLRFRVHALMQWINRNPIKGIEELTPGIRSLQIHFDPNVVGHPKLLEDLRLAESQLDEQLVNKSIPSRIVHLPLAWDDPVCEQAMRKYDKSVRPDAPWGPSNIEFIRRINGLESINAVKKVVFDASYLVMGLGDVYLGAPVATPINPKHRLVTTKYNPARTWTAENSVGIGGAYMCVYGMEGPGGYQLVGRTLQMWNRYHQTMEFSQPWLLRFFDQIQFYEVSSDELETIRQDFPLGRYPLKIEQSQLSLNDYHKLLEQESEEIEAFTKSRKKAFSRELANWHKTGQFNFQIPEQDADEVCLEWPDHHHAVESTVSGTVWKVEMNTRQKVAAGDTLLILESMKMEISVVSNTAGTVSQLLVQSGQRVDAGQTLVVIEPD